MGRRSIPALGDHIDRLYRAACALRRRPTISSGHLRARARSRALKNDDDIGYLIRHAQRVPRPAAQPRAGDHPVDPEDFERVDGRRPARRWSSARCSRSSPRCRGVPRRAGRRDVAGLPTRRRRRWMPEGRESPVSRAQARGRGLWRGAGRATYFWHATAPSPSSRRARQLPGRPRQQQCGLAPRPAGPSARKTTGVPRPDRAASRASSASPRRSCRRASCRPSRSRRSSLPSPRPRVPAPPSRTSPPLGERTPSWASSCRRRRRRAAAGPERGAPRPSGRRAREHDREQHRGGPARRATENHAAGARARQPGRSASRRSRSASGARPPRPRPRISVSGAALVGERGGQPGPRRHRLELGLARGSAACRPRRRRDPPSGGRRRVRTGSSDKVLDE